MSIIRNFRESRSAIELIESSSFSSRLFPLISDLLVSSLAATVTGAINKVLANPINATTVYVGAVNGGIWKSTNASSSTPGWVSLTDHLYSLSVGAMAFDHSDSTYETIVAAIGSQSSYNRLGGLNLGLIRTTDGGDSWTVVGDDALYGYRLAGVYAWGSTISTCATGYGLLESQSSQNGATFSSIDDGDTWVRSNTESCTDMQADRTVSATVFRASLKSGIVVSRDSGVTWSGPLLLNFPARFSEPIVNIRLSVKNIGTSKAPKFIIHAGFLSAHSLQGLLRGVQVRGDEFTWTDLDLPTTTDGGVVTGLVTPFVPGRGVFAQPGGFGLSYFSIATDPQATEIVYVGGDRQPTGGTAENPAWPNSIGATTYDGRLFRCNSSLESGSQCSPITHAYAASNSAPHADSRDMTFDAAGRLIEVDDGGVYVRTSPRSSSGQWFSLNANLTVQEAQSVAFAGGNTFVTGNQDTGITYGAGGSNTPWTTLAVGDGAVVRSGRKSDGSYIVYWSSPYLAGFSSTAFVGGNPTGVAIPRALEVEGTNNSLQKWVNGTGPSVSFYQNYVVNTVDPSRLLFAFSLNGFVFESLNSGASVKALTIPGVSAGQVSTGAAVYGGVYKGTASANFAYVAGLDTLALRGSAADANWTITNYPPVGMRWTTIAHVAVHPTDFSFVVVLGTYGEVAYSKDFGASWTVISPLEIGVLVMPDSQQLRIAIVPGDIPRFVVSGRTGVYVYQDSKSKWWRIASATGAYVSDMAYDASVDTLYVSTLGRSVWGILKASKTFTNYAFEHSRPTSSYVRPPKVPAWQTLTYVFAALTVVLFLTTLVASVAFLTTKLRDEGEEDVSLLVNEKS